MTEDQLAFLNAYDLAALLHSKQLSPVEVTHMMLSRIERVDKTLLSYVTVTHEAALAQARVAEAAALEGDDD